MREKFLRKTKPVRIVITQNNHISVSPEMLSAVSTIPEDLESEGKISGGNNTRKRNQVFLGQRKKSKTEPAIVLSQYRKKQRDKIEQAKSPQTNKKWFQNKKVRDSTFASPMMARFGAFPGEAESVVIAGTIGSIASFSGSQLFSTMVDDAEKVDVNIFNNFEFPIRNLVFEGGGNKGMAYVGALQVLEEAGIMKKIKRVAGSSVGAITASLVAVGYTSQDLKEFMDQDLRKVLVDHRCGYCSLLPNLLQGFGWNPGKRLFKWFGEQLRERTGNADITFKELLQRYGRELCIVVTNLSQMSTDYFHPKTTPNIPIRTAVRMSTAMPGVFQSVKYKVNENTDVYVDGGLLCNYPIHAFDGWWLSMDPEDSFFQKLQPLEDFPRLFAKSERFGKWNNKTLGIILYSHTETELMKMMLKARQGNNPPKQPNTKLYRKRRKMRMKQQAAQMEHQAVVTAVGKLIKELRALHIDDDGVISEKEMKKLFETASDFTEEDKFLLFESIDYSSAFEQLDKDGDGEITFQELLSFLERKGVGIQTRFLGYCRKEITHLTDFISTLQDALSINVKRNYVDDRDIERTIGIDTDYIETQDYELEAEDKEFLIETGARATRAFLRDFAKKHPECRRRRSAMLSKQFFDSAFEGSTENEVINNNLTNEIDRRNGIESTSTAISFLSSDSDIPKYGHQESPQLLRRRLDLEEEFDFGIPGAYR
ncbi:uncharacterized protein LOC135682618 isoform X2 [Rhopilema esculentum]|uniref:uncharacterized protein LOC135682618 isoform X2 n=1 Tax=Rhopilema esculentum TaxID=499914 RepID=UPI0031E08307